MNNQMYSRKDYKELQSEAYNAQITELQTKINKLQAKADKASTHNGPIAVHQLHRYNVLINLYTREINYLTNQNQRVNTALESQVLTTDSLVNKNEKYKNRADLIEKKERELANQVATMNRLHSGELKNKITKRVEKLDKKIEKLKKKNIKLENKQVKKIIKKDIKNSKEISDIDNYSRREINTMLAKRDVYRQEMEDARAAENMQGISKLSKSLYAKKANRSLKKVRKLNDKLIKIRNKRIQAQGANQRTIPRRRTQGTPTR